VDPIPRIAFEVDAREFREAQALRGERRWRSILLEALGVEETKRKCGPIHPSSWGRDP